MRRFSINNLTRRKAPVRQLANAYADIAKEVLPSWDVSLVFLTPQKAREFNKKLRGKSYVPNVLSYEAGTRNGEVFICLAEAAQQASKYGMEADEFVLFLFIHGLLHLKGLPHGATMERRERMLLARFLPAQAGASTLRRAPSTHGTTHRNRHRHRNLPSEGRRRRGGRG